MSTCGCSGVAANATPNVLEREGDIRVMLSREADWRGPNLRAGN
jgi:hypothetical protein